MKNIDDMLAEADRLRVKLEAKQSGGRASSPWYSITNVDGQPARVRIYDEIGMWGVDADAFAADIANITADTIEVAINSPGGSVFQGLAIYNSLRTHPARIVTRVDGLAASAASFIAQAGDERVMVESSQMMIHNAMATAFGNADDFREIADFLDMQSENIAELYASRSDRPAAEFLDLMAAETWMTADEAVEHGLADRVLVPERRTTNLTDAALDSAAAVNAAAADVDAASGDPQGLRAAQLRNIELRRVIR